MSLAKDYKQYFTPDRLAEYMVSIIPEDTIKTVVDLSMGECGLLEKQKIANRMQDYMELILTKN